MKKRTTPTSEFRRPLRPITLRSRSTAAFTIIEILTVVFIGIVLILISVPAIRGMAREVAVSNGVNSVSVSVAAAHAKSIESVVVPTVTDNDGNLIRAIPFGGAAALFCPAGEIRIVLNDSDATDQNTDLLAIYNRTDITDPAYIPPAYGFFDDPALDYVNLPNDSGVVGIYRNGGQLQLLAPPFAVRFSSDGILVSRGEENRTYSEAEGWVYYPKDGETPESGPTPQYLRDIPAIGVSVVGNERSEATNLPEDWATDPALIALATSENLSPKLPFTRIEPCIGVIVYQDGIFKKFLNTVGADLPWTLPVPTTTAFDNAVAGELNAIADTTLSDSQKIAAWLLNRNNTDVRVLLINRYTGSVIREADIQ